jgi:centrosomal protein CEP104
MAGPITTLNFKVFHCSSQDPSFPIGELVSPSSRDQSELLGWQSQRFCVYPQEVVLQFPTLVHLKQVQFLAHQSKIPSRIELFSYAPDLEQRGGLVSPHANIAFTRLGHFSLDDNVRTNYQARELKTVYLEQFCQYLKVVIHKNHLNA